MTIKVQESHRLFMREANEGDAVFVLELLNNPSWLKFIGDRGVKSLSEARNYINSQLVDSYNTHGFGLLVIVLKDSDAPIGLCGLLKRPYLDHPDLGFAILPGYEGKGYVYEASQLILDHAFTILLHERVLATTKEQNQRSINLLLKLGFQFEKKINPESGKNEILLYSLDHCNTSKSRGER